MQVNNVQSFSFGSVKGENVIHPLKTFSKLHDMAYLERAKIILGDEFSANYDTVKEIGKHKDVVLQKTSYYYEDSPENSHTRDISLVKFCDELVYRYETCIYKLKDMFSDSQQATLASDRTHIIEFPDPSM